MDDDADGRELIRYVLDTRGADVMSADSAGEALHLLANHRSDVLVADIGMPEQDSLALIRVIRAQAAPAYRSIPAIAVTAHAAIRERDEGLGAGFQLHLSKPVDPDQLALYAGDYACRPPGTCVSAAISLAIRLSGAAACR